MAVDDTHGRFERLFPPGFTCPDCNRTSYNPTDIAERYCGQCRKFFDAGVRTGTDQPGRPMDLGQYRLLLVDALVQLLIEPRMGELLDKLIAASAAPAQQHRFTASSLEEEVRVELAREVRLLAGRSRRGH